MTKRKPSLSDVELLEKLSALDHHQWTVWSKELVLSGENLSKERLDRWKRLWATQYSDLTEEMKEQDRVWARIVLNIINSYMQNDEDII